MMLTSRTVRPIGAAAPATAPATRLLARRPAAPRRGRLSLPHSPAAADTSAPSAPTTTDVADTPAPIHHDPVHTPTAHTTAAAEAPATSTPADAPASTSATEAPAAPAAPTTNENFKGDMLKPSVFNTPWARAAAVLGAVAVAAGSSALLPARLGAFLHLTAYAVLLGTQLWNTFFVGLTMFKVVPRQTFGKVQAKLFPQYFALTTGANLLALATLALAGAAATPSGTAALGALGVSLAGLVVNWLCVEPIATDLMFKRYDIENLPEKTQADKEQIGVLYKQFGKWHGISSLINLVSFCVAVAHGWYLASLLAVV